MAKLDSALGRTRRVVGFAMVAVYLSLMVSEGNNSFSEVAPWVLAMLVPAILSLMAWTTEVDRRARAMLLGAAALYLAIGVLSIFSLGVGFLAAGLMALFAANELPRSSRQQPIQERALLKRAGCAVLLGWRMCAFTAR